MSEKIQHWYLHVDLDAFFASVEQLDHPEYRGKPVIVGGKPEDKRSVVSTASYEARKFGIHSAMPTAQAYKLCPQGIFVHGRMDRYAQLSYLIMEIFRNYSPDVDQMSIDEAFIDITGTEGIFGSPLKTSEKIRKEVFDKTGLTVSAGLAQTKYFAKIASDINKPNGFYFVEPGKEQELMLNLPVKKIFGIGKKSQERLFNCGLKTTRDIYERSLESLKFLCGENQGEFLYNIVRGKITDECFEKEAKSHSMSSETTFINDITDSYTIETVLMELSYGIMFRLLKEKGFSRTVMVKIRYEDFSTVSIQQTFERNILTIDELFNKAKLLFEKKWENGRGVRLLGLCLENIEKEEKPYQQDLFDNGSDKKQKVEKAILHLSQKHPEIKIHKARMMEKINKGVKIILPAIFSFFLLCTSKLYAQETSSEKSLFDYEVTGFWEFSVNENLLSTFGNNTDFAFSFSVPVIKQNVELYTKINLNHNWSFSADFADSFNKNTFAIKYKGDKYLKSFLASNRNIIFPAFYSASVFGYNPGGGQNESAGISFHLEDFINQKYQADFILRYEASEQKNATFYGKNKVTETKLLPKDFVIGKQFVLPTEYINAIKDIYIENTNGKYNDTTGKKYNKLSRNDYLLISSQNLLILSDNAQSKKKNNIIPEVLVTFDKPLDTSDFGSYTDSTSFLGQIKIWFGDNIELENFAPPLTKTIEGEESLILQSNRIYSPFAVLSNYDLGLKTAEETLVINKSSETKSAAYQALPSQDDLTASMEDYFKEKHNYTRIINTSTSTTSFLQPENRYAFADTNPFIYLNGQDESNYIILKKNYTKVSNFDIGKKVQNSSINVFINGNQITDFSYAETSGFVTINKTVSDSDKVYITWNEEASGFDNGNFIAAAGFIYTFNPFFTADFSLTSRIPFSPSIKYATADSPFTSYTALTGGISYKKENISLKESLSIALENPNLSDCLLVTSSNESENKTDLTGYKLYLQLGIDYDDSFSGEVDTSIPFWNISELLQEKDTWQIGQIKLSAEDCSKLLSYKNARLIIINETGLAKNGKISFGPYEVINKGIKVQGKNMDYLYSTFENNHSSYVNTNYTDKNHSIDAIYWKQDAVNTENIIIAEKYLPQSDFSSYQFVNYDFALNTKNLTSDAKENENILVLELLDENKTTAIKLMLNASTLQSSNNGWHTLTVNTQNNQVLLDQKELPSKTGTVILNKNILPVLLRLTINTASYEDLIQEGSFYSGDIYYTKSFSNFAVKNQAEVFYKKDGTIWKINETDILKNGEIKILSNQKLNFNNNDSSFSTSTALSSKITLWKLGLSDTFSLVTQEQVKIEGTSYSIKTETPLFKILSLEDNFAYTLSSMYAKKEDKLSLDFNKINIPVSVNFSTLAIQNTKEEQKYSSELKFIIPIAKTKLNTSLNINLFGKDEKTEFQNSLSHNYTNLTKKQFSNGQNQTYRTIEQKLASTLKTPLNGFEPTISFSLTDVNTNYYLTETTSKGNLEFTIPFIIKKQNFSFSLNKNYSSRINYFSPQNYFSALDEQYQNQNKTSWFYSSIPFADFFDQELPSKIKETVPYFTNAAYTTSFKFAWKRPLANTINDLFLPSALSLNICRNIIVSDTIKDDYQIKTSINQRFLNLLTKKWLTFFKQDEYNSSITFITKFSTSGEPQFLLSGYESLLLFIDPKNTLKLSTDYKFNSFSDWNIKLGGNWTHSGTNTILIDLPSLLFKNLKDEKTLISRKELFTISFGKNNDLFTQIYEYTHYCEAIIQEKLNINGSIGTSLSFTQTKATSLNINASLGFKLTF